MDEKIESRIIQDNVIHVNLQRLILDTNKPNVSHLSERVIRVPINLKFMGDHF